MPTRHAQRVARVRRAPRVHGRLLHHVAYAMSVLPVRDVTPVSERWQYADAAATTARRLTARAAYANKQLWAIALAPDDDLLPWNYATDYGIKWDDAPTSFMPEDWRLECVTHRDELPDYMGGDLDGLFL